ncbi:MAG: glycosyltransferase [Bryobacterales bacterium]|jgi:glycosyltransferase involved in cell wall biosynthesis|nr:glycosyltransferase [Bryobacterales bacterium]
MQPGLVSVMMPAYNAERHIRQAIESALGQHYPDWELLIVNDGSTDGTAEIARGFTDARIRVIDQPNGGEAAARNTALRHMKGEFVSFLDTDDAYYPEHLEVIVGRLRSDPSLDAAYSDGYYCDQSGTVLQTLSSRRLQPAEGCIFEQVVYSSSMLGPPLCVVLRRRLAEELGLLFDTSITIGPDWDFFTRFSERARFAYVDRPTCLYRLHDTNITVSVGHAKRSADMAKCRRKAIRMDGFKRCSVGTRAAVFYDLLVNLLAGQPAAQSEVTGWAEFQALPRGEQARLLRLMASEAILRGGDPAAVKEWLEKARELNPRDLRAAMLGALFPAAPGLCRRALEVRRAGRGGPQPADPFWDVKRKSGAASPAR